LAHRVALPRLAGGSLRYSCADAAPQLVHRAVADHERAVCRQRPDAARVGSSDVSRLLDARHDASQRRAVDRATVAAMPAKTDAALKRLLAFGLKLPGAHTKAPWPGHNDLAVNDKTFAYLSVPGEPFSIGC